MIKTDFQDIKDFISSKGITLEQFQNMCEVVKESPKYDEGKLRWNLLPIEQLEEVVKVLEYGAIKYEANAWQGVNDGLNRYTNASIRHLTEYLKGNKIDNESGLSHLSHSITNLLFMMWFENKVE